MAKISSALSTIFRVWSSLDRISSLSLDDVLEFEPVVDVTFDSDVCCGVNDDAVDVFCEPDVDIVSTLLDMDVNTAQYSAEIAHLDNCLILFGDNGSNTGNDNANDNNEMSDDICGRAFLIAIASACGIGRYNGFPWMTHSS